MGVYLSKERYYSLGQIVIRLKQGNGMKPWCKGPEKEQPMGQLRTSAHNCNGNKGRRNTHTPRSSPAKQSLVCYSLVPALYSPDQTHSSNMMCSLGQRKISAIGGAGGGVWMGTSALWRHLKSNLLFAWGKHLGHTAQTTSGAVSGERLGELMRKEAEWMQSEL